MYARILALLFFSASCFTAAQQADQLSILLLLDGGTENLPYQLGSLDKLSYPKNRTHIWISGAGGEVDSLKQWVDGRHNDYKRIDQFEESEKVKIASTEDRLEHFLLKGCDAAIIASSRYALILNSNVFIHYVSIVEHLIEVMKGEEGMGIISPMLDSKPQNASNNLKCSDELNCEEIRKRTETGVFTVPEVSKIWLIDLQHQFIRKLIHHYSRSSVNQMTLLNRLTSVGMKLHLTNKERYGFALSSDYSDADQQDLINSLAFHHEVHVSDYISPKQSELSKYFEMVYVINLKRRPQKLANIKNVVYQLGITNVNYTFAVDGLELIEQKLLDMGYKAVDGYDNPFRGGGMKMGEIGCLLSHYFIWLDAQQRNYNRILILEDDASILYKDFHDKWAKIRSDINIFARSEGVQTPWELLYLGRRMQKDTVDQETGYSHLVRPGVSFWTVAYALSRSGIRKIMDTEPISHALPSDDFLAVMYNKYYEQKVMDKFPRRDLAAFSVVPCLIAPSHFPGDGEYISDTELESVEHSTEQITATGNQLTLADAIEETHNQIEPDANNNKHSASEHDEF